MKLKGIDRIKTAYSKKVSDIAERNTAAAVYAILSTGAANAATMTPVDTSTLINSQYVPRIEKSRQGAVGYVGYTASYALFVHNKPGVLDGLPRANGRGEYWDPGGEPGFLEKGFSDKDWMQIIRSKYAI